MDMNPHRLDPSGTLPQRIDALARAAPDTPWAVCAEAARSLALGLIMRGLQRGHRVLFADPDTRGSLPLALGALGAGAVLQAVDGMAREDLWAQAAAARCAVVIMDGARWDRHAAAVARYPELLAVLMPALPQAASATHFALALPDILTLGRAVQALDPGMWDECLDRLRPDDPAISPASADGDTVDHQACARVLARFMSDPAALAAGLFSLLEQGQGRFGDARLPAYWEDRA